MAVGQHMDHQIVFEVGVDLIRRGENDYDVAFYEDYPYTLLPGMLTYRMKITGMAAGRQCKHYKLMQKHMKSSARDAYRLLSSVPSLKMNNWFAKPLAFLVITLLRLIAQHQARTRSDIFDNVQTSPQLCDISAVIDHKIRVISAYPSQLCNPLFSKRRIKDTLATYAPVMGLPAGHFGERYWNVTFPDVRNPV